MKLQWNRTSKSLRLKKGLLSEWVRDGGNLVAPVLKMNNPILSLVVSFSALLFLSGCSTPEPKPKSASQDHAFITYWPPEENNSSLRVAVKDMIDVKGAITTGGSKYLQETGKPATRDAKCIETARARKVQLVGKTNLGELGTGVSGMNTYFGTPRNRLSWRSRPIPGGSSSGSAVAVANDWADVAIGTDTAGSVRVPAACCGVYGLKTTWGLISLDGVLPMSPKHLDTIGPLAKDIPRLVQGMDLLQPGFAGSYRSAVAATPTTAKIRIGRLYLDGTDHAIDRAIDAELAARGFQIVPLPASLKEAWKQAQKDGYAIAAGDVWKYQQELTKQKGVSSTTKAIISLGKVKYGDDYASALRRKSAWQQTLQSVFRQVDLIALPTLQKPPPTAPLLGSALYESRVLDMQNTVPVNYAGFPALAVPIPLKGRTVPMTSVQLVGPPRSEAKLVAAGRFFEEIPGPPSGNGPAVEPTPQLAMRKTP